MMCVVWLAVCMRSGVFGVSWHFFVTMYILCMYSMGLMIVTVRDRNIIL